MKKNWDFLRVVSFILYLGIIHAASNQDFNVQKLKTVYSWKSLDFAYPNATARQEAIKNGEFNEGQIIPLDVDVVYANSTPRVFITIPRFQKGVPATLGIVTNELSSKGDPIIEPYPNWEWNSVGDCNHLTSIYRVAVDDCDRLWVLDTGTIRGTMVCQPQLLVFNFRTDQLLSTYKFPLNQIKQTSLLVTPIVDIISRQNQCLDTFVYVADVLGYQLLVYDHKQKKSWNIQDDTLNLNPAYGNVTINDVSYQARDGIFSGAVSPSQSNGDRIFYFHTLTSLTESWVPTSVIRNFTTFSNSTNPPAGSIQTSKLTRNSQSSAEAMSKDGILFYGLLQETSLGCWNSVTHPTFGGNNLDIIVTSSRDIEFNSGMKIRRYKEEPEKLWMITIPLPRFINNLMTPNVTNFRILSNDVSELIRGTKCDLSLRQKIDANPCKSWWCRIKSYHS